MPSILVIVEVLPCKVNCILLHVNTILDHVDGGTKFEMELLIKLSFPSSSSSSTFSAYGCLFLLCEKQF